MTTPNSRRGSATRARGPQALDAGLHAESEAGPIDVGLAIEPGVVGVIIDAPIVGQLRVAFEVAGDGATRLATLTRRKVDGSQAQVPPTVVIDETATLALEGEVQRLTGQLRGLVAERDEARERAAALDGELQADAAALQAQEAKAFALVDSLRSALDVEKYRRVRAEADADVATGTVAEELRQATAERESLATQVVSLEAELTAARASVGELTAARDARQAKLDAAEATVAELRAGGEQAAALQAELAAATAAIAELRAGSEQLAGVQAELAAATATIAELRSGSEQVAGLQARLDAAESTVAELRAGSEQVAGLQAKLDAAESTVAELRAGNERLAGLQAELTAATATVAELRAGQETAASELAQARAGAEGSAAAAKELARVRRELTDTNDDLARRSESLAEALRQRDAVRAELEATRAAPDPGAGHQAQLEAERKATQEARDVARKMQAGNARLLAERDEARTIARQLHQQLAAGAGAEGLKAESAHLRASLDGERAQAATASAERDRLRGQVEALTRQLDSERGARAKAVAERDQFRERFLALTSGRPAAPKNDFFREETRPYNLDALRAAQPDAPTAPDPALEDVPWSDPSKKDK